ncbi:DNA repair protein XRCC3 isoform X2 [Sander lucioperca]|uniref:DNA repair protein XRCC3 isoform X2 n=1 Tax=Sander lucioperca TaxID=283035 RepID=UPI00165386C6|nr:DNA repair protein XRCC3 isoform X2 [Sander lucioperca]
MDWDQLELNPRIIASVRRVKLKSVREALCVSGPDLQRLTGLSRSDVQQLQSAAATACRRRPPTPGAVYICTEDSFPIRRLQQLILGQSSLRPDVPLDLISRRGFSDHVYVEHAADLGALQVCLSRRVPLLLARRHVRLLVVDSVAALFRSEFLASDWLERSKQLISFSHTLHTLSLEFNTPVLCINQVTDVFGSDDSLGPVSGAVSPALGLAWANQVMVRLMMRRLQGTVARGDQSSALRRLEVAFAPHLARDGRNAAVWREGVLGVDGSDRCVITQTDVL